MVTARATRGRALLVAISGIDGSGKSTLASKMAELLEGRGLRPARIVRMGRDHEDTAHDVQFFESKLNIRRPGEVPLRLYGGEN